MERRYVGVSLLVSMVMSFPIYANNQGDETVLAATTTTTTTATTAGQKKDQVTGTGASGEAQTAVMDQNGRWHVSDKPKESATSNPAEPVPATLPSGKKVPPPGPGVDEPPVKSLETKPTTRVNGQPNLKTK